MRLSASLIISVCIICIIAIAYLSAGLILDTVSAVSYVRSTSNETQKSISDIINSNATSMDVLTKFTDTAILPSGLIGHSYYRVVNTNGEIFNVSTLAEYSNISAQKTIKYYNASRYNEVIDISNLTLEKSNENPNTIVKVIV